MGVVFGDGFADVPSGKRVVKVRGQEIAARRVVYRGRSTIKGLHAGRRLTLVGHPDAAMADETLLVTRVTHRLMQGDVATEGYSNEFEAIPASVPFRPPRQTPKPRI